MALPRDGRKYELLEGEILVSPTGFRHGYIGIRLAAVLMDFALKNGLGVAVDSSTGFRMKSGDCLSPDVSFVRKERLPKTEEALGRFFEGGPDLAVEVISPGERKKPVERKLEQYFGNGSKLVWIVNPSRRTVVVYHSVEKFETLRDGDKLDGELVLPGFVFPVSELFDMPIFGR
jgi:Uma2 family endonuclease